MSHGICESVWDRFLKFSMENFRPSGKKLYQVNFLYTVLKNTVNEGTKFIKNHLGLVLRSGWRYKLINLWLFHRISTRHHMDSVLLCRTVAKMMLDMNSAFNFLQYVCSARSFRKESFFLLKAIYRCSFKRWNKFIDILCYNHTWRQRHCVIQSNTSLCHTSNRCLETNKNRRRRVMTHTTHN